MIGSHSSAETAALIAHYRRLNDNHGDIPAHPLHKAFEQVAARHPDRTAVVSGTQRLTFAELNAAANRLAHALSRQYGITPGAQVGLVPDTSADTIVAMLAILKAGAAYVPMDADQPRERRLRIIQRIGLDTALCPIARARDVKDTLDRPIYFDLPLQDADDLPQTNPNVPLPPEATAYILFTSGSTGEPKGVQVSHRAVMRMVFENRVLQLEGESQLQSTSLMFDASVFEIWGSLLHGGACIRLGMRLPQADTLAQIIQQHGITSMWLTPPQFNAVVDDRPEAFAGLRQMVLGGEALSPDHCYRLLDLFPNLTIINGYGPTETTVFATFHRLNPAERTLPSVPIGKGLTNTQTWVLDRKLQPVAPGQSGELCLGGDALADGYIGRGDLTADRFVPHPYAQTPGERLYRSGDLVRLGEDDLLHYQGRIDRQIKIRGFRIEMDDVLHALRGYPNMGQIALDVRQPLGAKALVAWYTGERVDPRTLRSFLAELLPDYMIPTCFVAVDTMPTNRNGKLDVAALPDPDYRRDHGAPPHVAPTTPGERLLGRLWTEILNIPDIGIHDSFFDLGGNSIHAWRLLAQLSRRGYVLTHGDLVQRPTIAQLAAGLETRDQVDTPQPPAPLHLLDQEDLRAGLARELYEHGLLDTPDGDPAAVLEAAFKPPLNQTGLLLHGLQHPQSRAYFNRQVYHLHGHVDPAQFQTQWQVVLSRHASTRAFFAWRHLPFPLHLVARQWEPEWLVADWSDLDPVALERRLQGHFQKDTDRGFDMGRPGLMRFALIRTDARAWLFAVSFQHLILDGLSVNTLWRQFAQVQGGQTPSDPMATYHDAAHWLAHQPAVNTDALRRNLSGDETTPTPLPFAPESRVARTTTTHRVVGMNVAVEDNTLTGLKQLAASLGCSLNTLLQAGWALLLSRYARREEVTFGVTLSGRPPALPDGEHTVGLFINTLPLTLTVPADLPLAAWLPRIQHHQNRLLDHQALSMPELGGKMLPTAVIVRNYPHPGTLLGADSPFQIDHITAFEPTHFPLVVVCDPAPHFQLKLDYDPVWFSHDEAAQIGEVYARILDEMTQNPTRRLSALPCAAPPQPQPPTQFQRDICLHRLFEHHAAATPDAVALSFNDQTLSYRALNQAANRLARHLQAEGVQGGHLVGLCLDRTPQIAIATLAVLKAGAAYVPIDRTTPDDRLTFVLEDTAVAVVLTDGRQLPPTRHARALDLGRLDLSHLDPANLDLPQNPAGPAYIIYTSGSTGRPKGVLVTHTNVVRLFAATEGLFHFGPSDVWTLFHSYAFDFSVWELWGPLTTGGRLVIVPYDTSRNPETFLELLRTQAVTVLNQTPSAFRALTQAELQSSDKAEALRWVIFGGEALDPHALQTWAATRGANRPALVNMYGITETTVHVTWRFITETDMARPGVSPIGQPIADLDLYLLDDHGNTTPIGAPGELYVGGAGLASGYLNRPDLTAQRFVPNPFATTPGARLYRSGDLARRQVDNELIYMGRADHQVKIRGFRIELGEIETILAAHPQLAAAVVSARGEQEKSLIAHVVPKADAAPAVADLRAHLKEKLPDYMVPAAFVFMDALPLTRNGKVDRKALPEPQGLRPELSETFVAPMTPRQTILAAIWCEVLDLDVVGIHDPFFELGGDSILSLKVLAKARDQGLTFTLLDLFQHQTIAQLADRRGETPAETATAAVPFDLLRPEDRNRMPADLDDAYPLSRLQAGLVFHAQMGSQSSLYHNASILRVAGPYHPEHLGAALDLLAQRHPVLRTSIHLTGYSEPLQLVHRHAHIIRVFEPVEGLSLEQRNQLAQQRFKEEIAHHFVLNQGPLIRFRFVPLDDNTFATLFCEHHAIVDGWSVAAMLTDLFQIYLHQLDPTHALPRAPELQFRAFLPLEQEAIKSEVHRQFWLGQLEDMTPVSPATEAPAHPEQVVGRREFILDPHLSAGLRALSRRAGVPLKSVLLAAHLRILALITGSNAPVTGLVVNGRPEQTGAERVLGLFLNTLPLHLPLTGGSWLDLIKATFAAETAQIPYRRTPLAELQTMAGGTELFDVAFNFIHFHVYKEIGTSGEIRILDEHYFAKTNFTLLCEFGVDAFTDAVTVNLEYNPAKADDAWAERLGDYFTQAFSAMVAAPDQAYPMVNLLTPGDQHRIEDLNPAAVAEQLPDNTCLHHLFERSAARHPEVTALIFDDRQWTYGELDAQANQLAHHLMARGVTPESRVGLHLYRSAELLIAHLAILKAGAVSVPLDPWYPEHRLITMAADAQPAAVVSTSELESLDGSYPRILMDRDQDAWGQQPTHNPGVPTSPQNLLTLMYTSGSTGKPKGVAMTHAPLVNLVAQHLDGKGPKRTLQFAPVSFDVSNQEIFATWQDGGTLILVDEMRRRDPERLLTLLCEQRVERLFLPFVALENLAGAKTRGGPTPVHLREVIAAGEQLRVTPEVRAFFEGLPNCRLHNHYGPTETHVATALTLDGTGAVWPQLPTIGRPIANSTVHLLDALGQPLPPGVPGRLYIGGLLPARGYWNNPAATAEKFTPDPFASWPGSRMYDTGDLARLDAWGNLEFLGRADDQVKIRGFRVEPGEVENALAQLPLVAQAAVVIRNTKRGNQLVGYIVPETGAQPSMADLRTALAERLPDYMTPALFVSLEALPLTPSGKIARKALPDPETNALQDAGRMEPPQTETERVIIEIWSELLGLEQIGREDDFFALGGHSLLVVQTISRLWERLAINLPLQVLFEYTTVAGLGEHIDLLNPNPDEDDWEADEDDEMFVL